ncbi:MAG TPA: Mur ligase family protein [Chitinispirillaceae bacterium]|nr:Mur ligase family protein [Chitinispirillaceae bacterium]
MSLLINNKQYSSIHFIGILGSGMSALAQYLRWQGLNISGSDRLLNSEDTLAVKNGLLDIGCLLFSQDGSGIQSTTDAVCISTAIENSNADIAAAQKSGIPIFHRSDILAAIISTRKTIAIAGTSGKSTVTAMVFEFLNASGKSPSLISGASLKRLEKENLIGNAFSGSSELLVVEADESDGTLTKYHPYMSIILNVSKDHKTETEVISLFDILTKQSECTVINADDKKLQSLYSTITFSLENYGDWRPDTYQLNARSVEMNRKGILYRLPLPGRHNLSNCVAALCACEQLGCDRELLAEAVASYQGVARRFSVQKTVKGVHVVDDFAHNPEKIKAAIKAARGLSQKLAVIYQPHGFGPTRFLKNEYIEVFKAELSPGDLLFLLPIYYVGGSANKDISSKDIIDALSESPYEKYAPDNRSEVIDILKKQIQSECCILLMGARDPSLPSFAQKLADAFGGVSV